MHKILITGGAGFIPSCLAESLLKKNHKVVLVDNFLTGRKSNIPVNDRCTFVKADVNKYKEISTVMKAHKFDYVFHYAAVVGVKRTLDNPLTVLEDINGIKNVLNLSKDINVKRVFYSSSSEVYGEPVHLPQHEHKTPLNSRLPYAVVKNVGEAYFKSFFLEFGLEYTILRFFNTYGAKQSDDFVIAKFIKLALANDDITIYGDGSQTRTFCYIDDNIETTINALKSKLFINDIVNIGNDHIVSIKDLASLIIDISGSKSKIVKLPPLKDGDMTKRQPDISKMKLLLKRELTPLRTGLKKIIKPE